LQRTPLHKKENKLSKQKLIELFAKATKNCISMFSLMSQALTDEQKIEDIL